MGIPTASDSNVRHALNRWTFGPTPALTAQVKRSGLKAYLDNQLATWRQTDAPADAAVADLPVLRMSPKELWNRYVAGNTWEATDQLQAGTLLRAVHADHQLYERMVEFWSDHFAIDLVSEGQWLLKPSHDRDAIRKHALGRFEDLLIASSQSVAMLYSLDQTKSFAGNPNENFARELLELHTLGVDGGYGEADVKAAARLLTGWSLDYSTYGFLFWPWGHDSAAATILGKTYAQPGIEGGIALLKDLAHHPSTARFLARKLCRRFVSDAPSASLIASVAAAYLAADTDIAATLRHLFQQSEFWSSRELKHRRPIDAVVAFLRAASTKVTLSSSDELQAVWLKRFFVSLFESVGQAPFRWPTPDGFPDTAPAWIHPGGLLARWNVFLSIAQDFTWVTKLDLTALLGTTRPATAGALVDRIARIILSRAATRAERDACLAFLGASAKSLVDASAYERKARHLAALVASSPGFQKR